MQRALNSTKSKTIEALEIDNAINNIAINREHTAILVVLFFIIVR
jgi:hypothetical protein